MSPLPADPPASDEAMRAYYAARAAEYDRVYAKPERQADLAAMRAWLPPWFAGRQVLEVACGTGHWTRFIAPVAAGLVGVDAAGETLAIARSRVPAAQARFVVGNAYSLGDELGRFDAAFAGFWYSHIPRARRPGFLEGLARRLTPGALLVLIDNRYVEGSSTPREPADAEGDTWQQRRLEDGSVHRVLKNFPTPDELRADIGGVATEVEVVQWTHYWAVTGRIA